MSAGAKVLDCGCGIGGPARNIARFTRAQARRTASLVLFVSTRARVGGVPRARVGCVPVAPSRQRRGGTAGRGNNVRAPTTSLLRGGAAAAGNESAPPQVTGITINQFQVDRGNALCESEGVAHLAKLVQGDFMALPFGDATFDGVYAIEATCHAPDRAKCYSEILRVLKPGASFACYEWCLTDASWPASRSKSLGGGGRGSFGGRIAAVSRWRRGSGHALVGGKVETAPRRRTRGVVGGRLAAASRRWTRGLVGGRVTGSDGSSSHAPHGISTRHPRRRCEPSSRTIYVAAAASPRLTSPTAGTTARTGTRS